MSSEDDSRKALASSLAALVMVLAHAGFTPAPEGPGPGVLASRPVNPEGVKKLLSTTPRRAKLHWRSPVKERVVTFRVESHGKAPELMSVLVVSDKAEMDLWKQQDDWWAEGLTNRRVGATKQFPSVQGAGQPDFSKAEWIPFKTNVTVDFGPGDGGRWLWTSFKNHQDVNPQWEACHIAVQGSPPTVGITNPKQGITPRPWIQLEGYCTSALDGPIQDEVYNENNVITERGEGFVNHVHFDYSQRTFTTNFFSCCDVKLSPGTNTLVLHLKDRAGYAMTTNCVFVFSTVGKTNPPVFRLDWPQDGGLISGREFDLHGPCDDPTATVTALICDDRGNATRLPGFVERNGCLWVERVPLAEGISHITIVTADAAGNSSLTNITLGKSKDVLYMDPVADPQQLWQPRTRVTGFYSRTDRSLSVNGVGAKIQPDGRWVAEDVPVNSPNGGGTASFRMRPEPDDEQMVPSHSWQPTSLGAASKSLQAGLSFAAVSTNEYNHYPICLGITNTAETNQLRRWMLPSAEGRFALRLFDQEGKPVPPIDYLHKSVKALPDNLSIHHLGKKEIGLVDGVIPVGTNMAVQLASMNVDQYFHIPPPGTYRLEVEERLFQIAEDGRLLPITLPPVVTGLKVIEQPSEMTFYLKGLAQQRKLFWGPTLGSLRAGVAYDLPGRRGGKGVGMEVYLENLSTNSVRNLRLPRIEEQFDVSLVDATGRAVPKTALGMQRGLPLKVESVLSTGTPGFNRVIGDLIGIGNPRRPRRLQPVFLSARDATPIASFKLHDLFESIPPGKYRLTYQQRLYQLGSTNRLTGVTMPTVVVPLEIH